MGNSGVPSGRESLAVQKRILLDNALAVRTVDNGITI
jgi:hypothetical protein